MEYYKVFFQNCLLCVIFRNVKIYNVQDYSVVATLTYSSPILAMGLSVSINKRIFKLNIMESYLIFLRKVLYMHI